MGLLRSLLDLLDATIDNVDDEFQEISKNLESNIDSLSNDINQRTQRMQDERNKRLGSK